MLKRGDLLRLHQGVYRAPDAPRTREQATVAAALSLCGPVHTAVISHLSAAAFHGFHAHVLPPRPTLTMPRGGTSRSAAALVRTCGDLPPEEVTMHRSGLLITTRARTVLDLALLQPSAPRLDRFLDRCLLDRHATIDELWAMFLRRQRGGRQGMARLRLALHLRSGDYAPTESELEQLGIEALAAADEPPPVRQHPLPGPMKGRVDLAYPEALLIIELDGATHRLIETNRHDQRRDATAAVSGWQVLRFGWQIVRYDGPWFAETVGAVRRSRLRLIAAGATPPR